MLCPRCRIEARLAGSREEVREGVPVIVREFVCRDKKCADFGTVVAETVEKQAQP